VSRLAHNVDAHAACGKSARHDAHRDARGVELGSLFDVQFEVGINRPIADGRVAAIADARELVAEAHARLVRPVLGPTHAFLAREHQGGQHRRIEARAFLVGPVHDLDGPPGGDAAVLERS
jgi:hypothetical protein